MEQRVIYLASGSPRRRDLVRSLGIPVVTGVAPLDEEAATAAFTGDTACLAEHLAREKADAFLRAHAADLPANAPVVAADTTVLLDGDSLGKPRDDDDARRMLALLRNRTHAVATGIAVTLVASVASSALGATFRTPPVAHDVQSLSVTTQVTMREYTDHEIDAYVSSGDPHDKAGAYAIQHAGFRPVGAIAGCYLSVVGLPLCALSYLLASVQSATPTDTARYESQRALAKVGRCPWSTECRGPFTNW